MMVNSTNDDLIVQVQLLLFGTIDIGPLRWLVAFADATVSQHACD